MDNFVTLEDIFKNAKGDDLRIRKEYMTHLLKLSSHIKTNKKITTQQSDQKRKIMRFT